MNVQTYDVGILTVIGPELEAVQRALKIHDLKNRFHHNGSLYWQGKIRSRVHKRDLRVVVTSQAQAGEAHASAAASQLIAGFNPAMMFLAGIAAGRRRVIKIGDVALSREVVDATAGVIEDGKHKLRSLITPLRICVAQMVQSPGVTAILLVKEANKQFRRSDLVIPAGEEEEYAEFVAQAPALKECAVYSSDSLLRDPTVLENAADNIHQGIRIGEMEAGGFIKACERPHPPVLWLVIRGVSDFGDKLKNDDFHRFASSSAAAYLKCFLQRAADLRLVRPDIEGDGVVRPRRTSIRPNNIPFSHNPHFRGRQDTISRLHQAVGVCGQAVLSQTVAVSGQGGIGKTQSAVEYAWQYHSYYRAMLWIPAETPQSFRAGLAALAGPIALGLPVPPSASEEDRRLEVLRWLRENRGWLLICDNADTPQAVAAVMDALPPALGGSVLITSRLAEWPPTIHVELLEPLTPEAALAFLLERSARSESERADARHVAQTLGCFPLALEQAAGWVSTTRQSWQSYRRRLRENHRSVLSDPGHGGVNYQKTILTTWTINFRELSELPQKLLRCISFLAGEPVPEALIAQLVPESPNDLENAVRELAKYSLVRREESNVILHRLTQWVVRDALRPTERTDHLAKTLEGLRNYCPQDGADSKGWDIWQRILPHSLSVIAHCESEGLRSPGLVEFIQNTALFVQTAHRPEEAQILLVLADTMAGDLATDTRLVAASKNALGGCLWQIGRGEIHAKRPEAASEYLLRAEEPLRRAIEICLALDPQPLDLLAKAYNNLGNVLRDLGILAEAETHLRKALDLDIERHEVSPATIAIRRNNLGLLLQDQGRHDAAEPEFIQALEITAEACGADDPAMVIRHHNIGKFYWITKRREDAKIHLERAVQIAERHLEEGHQNRRRAVQTLREFESAAPRL